MDIQLLVAAGLELAMLIAVAYFIACEIIADIRARIAYRKAAPQREAAARERAARWTQAKIHWQAMRAAQAAGDKATADSEYRAYKRLAY